MNRILNFLLAFCFGISIIFPILYIYQPIFIKCDKKQQNLAASVSAYTILFSLVFSIVFMAMVVSMKKKCINF